MTSKQNIQIDEIISKFLHQEVIYEPQLLSFERKVLRSLKNLSDIEYFSDKIRQLKSKLYKSGSLKLDIKKQSNEQLSKTKSAKSITLKSNQKKKSKTKTKLKKNIYDNVFADKQTFSISPIMLINRNLMEWFKESNVKIKTEELQLILNQYEVKIQPNEIITLRSFKNNELGINRIYNEFLIKNINVPEYVKPIVNPFFKSKYQNPSKVKDGNYRKLIYIRTKT